MRKRGNLQGTLILFLILQTFQIATRPVKAENDLVCPKTIFLGLFQNDGIYAPSAISADKRDSIITSEPSIGRINILNADMALEKSVPVTGAPLCALGNDDGDLLIGNPVTARIEKYSYQGQLISIFEDPPEKLIMPSDIAADSNGLLYILDSRNCSVNVFDREGSYKYEFGSPGSAPGQFNFPAAISFMPDSGNLAVADQINGRVQIFNINGNHIRSFGSIGAESGQFMRLQGLAADNQDRIYTADSQLNRIQVFSASGDYLTTLETPAGKHIQSPQDILIDGFNRILVASSGNQCLASWLLIDDSPENICPVTPQSAASSFTLLYDPEPLLQSLYFLELIFGNMAESLRSYLIQFRTIYKIEATALLGFDADEDKVTYEFGLFNDPKDETPLYSVMVRPKGDELIGHARIVINQNKQNLQYWRVRSTDGIQSSPWGCSNPLVPDLDSYKNAGADRHY